jgi:hypothetical protein
VPLRGTASRSCSSASCSGRYQESLGSPLACRWVRLNEAPCHHASMEEARPVGDSGRAKILLFTVQKRVPAGIRPVFAGTPPQAYTTVLLALWRRHTAVKSLVPLVTALLRLMPAP